MLVFSIGRNVLQLKRCGSKFCVSIKDQVNELLGNSLFISVST